MPTNAPIVFQNGSLPEGFCFTNWQTLFNTFSALLNGYLPGQYNVFNYGNTEPAAEDRGKPWFRLNADGSPDKWYVYFGGAWVSPHPVAAGADEIRMYKGLLADLVNYDGGSAGAVSDNTGPMWEEDTDMRARFPVGPGTLPSATVIGVGDTGGEEKHSLTEAEMPPHTHLVISSEFAVGVITPDSTNFIARRRNFGASDDYTLQAAPAGSEADAGKSSEVGGSGSPAAVTAHNTMPPYRGVYFIKRTARKFYTP